MPCAGSVLDVTVSDGPSTSESFPRTETVPGPESSAIDQRVVARDGASLTGVTVIETVAVSVRMPSLTV